MRCNRCQFENMPGYDSCVQCGSILKAASGQVETEPPRMSKWKIPCLPWATKTSTRFQLIRMMWPMNMASQGRNRMISASGSIVWSASEIIVAACTAVSEPLKESGAIIILVMKYPQQLSITIYQHRGGKFNHAVSKCIQRTLHALPSLIKYMSINHCRANTRMPSSLGLFSCIGVFVLSNILPILA